MSDELPLVTVLIPARNEEADIEGCLDAVLAQDYPLDCLEVLVVDGGSTDGTRASAVTYLHGSNAPRWAVLDGPGPTPANLNTGLAAAQGAIVCRVDARSVVPPEYVRRCMEVLTTREEVVVVGGAQVAFAPNDATAAGRGIERALRNPWATGLARYRRRSTSGRTDTVYLGSFRLVDLRRAGGWDERFSSNQDFELNRRLGAHGTVWFEAGLAVGYRPRAGLRALWLQHRRFGRWKAAGWIEAGVPLSPRQAILIAVPPLGALGLLVLARRSIAAAAVASLAGFWIVERRGGPAPGSDRFFASIAMVAVVSGWWFGVVEQVARRLVGQRLLAAVTP